MWPLEALLVSGIDCHPQVLIASLPPARYEKRQKRLPSSGLWNLRETFCPLTQDQKTAPPPNNDTVCVSRRSAIEEPPSMSEQPVFALRALNDHVIAVGSDSKVTEMLRVGVVSPSAA